MKIDEKPTPNNRQADAAPQVDENLLNRLSTCEFSEITAGLIGPKPKYEYEIELIRRITLKDDCSMRRKSRDYFLTVFSQDILSSIAKNKKWKYDKLEEEYIKFISMPSKEKGIEYYKLTTFKRLNDCTLHSFVSTITNREFLKRKTLSDDDDNKKKEPVYIDMIPPKDEDGISMSQEEYFAYLLHEGAKKGLCDSNDPNDDDEPENQAQTLAKVRIVLKMLNPAERIVIEKTIMQNLNGVETFEFIRPYIRPNRDKPVSQWTNKEKSDAVSLLKGRALEVYDYYYTNWDRVLKEMSAFYGLFLFHRILNIPELDLFQMANKMIKTMLINPIPMWPHKSNLSDEEKLKMLQIIEEQALENYKKVLRRLDNNN